MNCEGNLVYKVVNYWLVLIRTLVAGFKAPIDMAKNIATYLKRRYAHADDDISSPLIRSVLRLAQNRAERLALRRRKSVLRTDHWLDEQLGFAGRE